MRLENGGSVVFEEILNREKTGGAAGVAWEPPTSENLGRFNELINQNDLWDQ